MSDSLLLDEREKKRFAEYLERQALSYKGIVEQMEKTNIPELVTKHIKQKALAFMLVANELRNAESFTVGG